MRKTLKEILLQVKIKNNLLWARMRELGIYTQSELARQAGISPLQVGLVANFKVQLNKRRGPRREKWPNYVRKLSTFLRCLPEDILPPWSFDIKQREFEREHSVESILPALVWLEEERLALPRPDEIYQDREIENTVGEALQTLPERTRKVFEMRHGLNGEYEHTLEEVGEKFGIGKERVRQIEHRALRTLRHPKWSKRLRGY